jgi:hypothetical protein
MMLNVLIFSVAIVSVFGVCGWALLAAWRRSEEEQLRQRRQRLVNLQRIMQAHDPETVPWSRLRRKQNDDEL